MDKIIFTDKTKIPSEIDLRNSLGNAFDLWQMINDYTYSKYPEAFVEWNYPGDKYGWSFRMKDKKRAILYLLPRENFFKVAFVFGREAADIIMNSKISKEIKKELESAKVYAEGRGIWIDIIDNTLIKDIKELIDIKLTY
jgi:hypothetical protein